MRTLSIMGCALALAGFLAPTSAAQVPSQEARVTLNLAERPLETIVDYLGRTYASRR